MRPNPWILFSIYLFIFLVVYGVITIGFTGIYLNDLHDLRASLHYSLDTLADRGRIPEPDRLTDSGRDWSCVEAVIGHVFPGVAFGLLFAVLPFRR